MNYEEERQAHAEGVSMTITSRVPSKWRFVDLETGNIWRWDENAGGVGGFKHADDLAITRKLQRRS